MRNLNKAVKRPVYPIPDVNDILTRLENSKFYSILDSTSAFHQIAVHPDSQKLLTFAAPSGRYCWQRLPYGIKSAPEVYQKMLSELLQNVPDCFVFYDDVLIAAKDESTHRKTLYDVLSILSENGITLNKTKCVFLSPSIEFLGHFLSQTGISPSPSKIEAIRNMPIPQSKEQLRSFLGLATYVGQKFVPNFAMLAAPLWSLCSKDATFCGIILLLLLLKYYGPL